MNIARERNKKRNMNKEYLNKLFEENKEKFFDSETKITSSKELEDYIISTIISNFEYDFNKYIDIDKLFDDTIHIGISHNGVMALTQTDADKERCGIGLEYRDVSGKLIRRDLISEEDFVMLMKFYIHTKDNDLYNEFINKDGINVDESYEIE